MAATKQISVRLPSALAERIEAIGPCAPYIIEAVREKLQRDEEAEMANGFALLAASPDMWDLNLPSGAQTSANGLLASSEKQNAA